MSEDLDIFYETLLKYGIDKIAFEESTKTLNADNLLLNKIDTNDLENLNIIENIDGDLTIDGSIVKVLNCFCRLKQVITLSILNSNRLESIVVSSYKAAKRLFKNFDSKKFPLISKPINGAQGWGIEKLDDLDSLMDFIKTYYINGTKPLIIEHYFNLIKEWRVFVVDVVITSYEKVRTIDTFKFNISQGVIPKKTTEEDQKRIVEYIKKRLIAPYDKGYYGVDIALKDNGELFLIEYNMQAGIAYAKDIAGVDVVYEMFKILFARDNKILKGIK